MNMTDPSVAPAPDRAAATQAAWGSSEIRLLADRVASLRSGSTHKVYRGWRFVIVMQDGHPRPGTTLFTFRSTRRSWRRIGPAMPWCSFPTKDSSPLAMLRPSPGPRPRSGRQIPSVRRWRRCVGSWRPPVGRRTRQSRRVTRRPIRPCLLASRRRCHHPTPLPTSPYPGVRLHLARLCRLLSRQP